MHGMMLSVIERLTDRQREALRLYARRLQVKEIAALMGISQNTASGYLTEAASLLNMGGRKAAAAALLEYEATHPEARGRFSVGEPLPGFVPDTAPPAARMPVVQEAPPPRSTSWWPPFRTGVGNDLTVVQRFVWFGVVTFGIVVGFGMFAFFVRTISDLARLARQ